MAAEQDFVGKQIGNYRIIAPIASGGFSVVYQAQHHILAHRIVAIKILHTYISSGKEREQFLQEGYFLEQLRHPHILPLIDVGLTDGSPYLISEYASYGSLRQLLWQHMPHLLPWHMTLEIISQVGQALDYAHQQHVIHRDLKPENILFTTPQHVVLADFGLAKMLSAGSMRSAEVSGTPCYMAPEQFRGSISRESDQYGLACIAYELVTGNLPFTSDDFIAIGFMHTSQTPPPLSQFNPSVPPYIEQAILKALAKERSERHSTISAFISALYPPTMYEVDTVTTPTVSARHLPQQKQTEMPRKLAMSEKSKEQWLEEGKSLHNQDRFAEAIEAFKQVLLLDPKHQYTYCDMGHSLFFLGRHQEAVEAFAQALHLNPDNVQAHGGQGKALNQLGRYDEALAAYDRALTLRPDDKYVLCWKADSLYELGLYQEAIITYKQSLHLNPAYEHAREGLKKAQAKLKKPFWSLQ